MSDRGSGSPERSHRRRRESSRGRRDKPRRSARRSSSGSRSRSRSPRHKRRRSYSRSRSRSNSPRRARQRRTRSPSPYFERRRGYSPPPYGRPRGGARGLQSEASPNRCIGVFGMSLYTTERDIKEYFEKFGPIEQVQLVYDHPTGRSRGFGFIYFENIEDAIEAKERGAGTEIDGHRIRIDYSNTQRAHTPTPGIYMGSKGDERGSQRGGYSSSSGRGGGGGYRRDDYDSPSPSYGGGPSRRRSRSYSYSPR